MWHTFPYRDVSPVDLGDAFPGVTKLKQPTVLAKIKTVGHEEECEALIDSGAAFCIFPISHAAALGLRIEDAKHVATNMTGYGFAGPSDLHFWPVTLSVAESDFSVTTMVGFSQHQEDLGFGVLGQLGFFSEVKQVNFGYGGPVVAFKTNDEPPSS